MSASDTAASGRRRSSRPTPAGAARRPSAPSTASRRGRRGSRLRAARPERRRQVHHRQDPHHPARGPTPARATVAGARRARRPRRRPARDRAGLAEAVERPDGHRRARTSCSPGASRGCPARTRGPAAAELLDAVRPRRRRGPARQDVVGRHGPQARRRDRARAPPAACCSSTSRPPGSTRRPARRCGRRSPAWPASEQVTVLLTTHYLDEADRLADRLAIVDHGRVASRARRSELKSELRGEPSHVELAAAAAPPGARRCSPAATGSPRSSPTGTGCGPGRRRCARRPRRARRARRRGHRRRLGDRRAAVAGRRLPAPRRAHLRGGGMTRRVAPDGVTAAAVLARHSAFLAARSLRRSGASRRSWRSR